MKKSSVILPAVLGLMACSPPVQQTQVPAPSTEQAAPPQPKPADQIEGTPAGTVMTPEYVATIGRVAYVWGWPLVNNLNRLHRYDERSCSRSLRRHRPCFARWPCLYAYRLH